jgi:transcriptional regulator with XRE-family HTH domain
MKEQKVFFPTNIKFLRNRKSLSQEQMAKLLGITRSKVNALENDQTKSAQWEDLLNFSDFYNISIDSLVKVDLSKLGELKLRELESGNDVYMSGTKLRVLSITVDKNNKENLEYVPIKAKAGYRAGLNDPEYIAGLPKFFLPNLPKGVTFRMFPTTGDSMLPIPEGSDVICRYIENWGNLKPRTLCIAILKAEQDFVFKQVTLQEKGLLMESLNKIYQPYVVPISEVLELWEFYSYQTREIPDVPYDLRMLTTTIKEMQEDLKVIKNRQ